MDLVSMTQELSYPRFQVIIPRRFAGLYSDVKDTLCQLPGAQVIVDRRFGERRRQTRPVSMERRHYVLDKRA
ncbi:MAG: hypothetical protein HY039_00435 [Nitrospirae bacterium]|nr:hypothetical protein [Nitrospirota bacterium]